jgi:hypothetical protein
MGERAGHDGRDGTGGEEAGDESDDGAPPPERALHGREG